MFVIVNHIYIVYIFKFLNILRCYNVQSEQSIETSKNRATYNMQMTSGDKMNELTLELQILAYTDVKRVQPFTRIAFTNRVGEYLVCLNYILLYITVI